LKKKELLFQFQVVISKAPLTSTDSFVEIFGPLLMGQATMILPDETLEDPSEFVDILEAFPVHRFSCDAVMLRHLCASFQRSGRKLVDRTRVKLVLITGRDVLEPELALEFFESFPSTKLGRTYELTQFAGKKSRFRRNEFWDWSLAPLK
jgi:hypothetical protein